MDLKIAEGGKVTSARFVSATGLLKEKPATTPARRGGKIVLHGWEAHGDEEEAAHKPQKPIWRNAR